MLARPRTLPTGFIAPCLPTKAHTLPSGGLWLHEIKHAGFRIIARKDGERVRLYSRPGNDFTRRFPLIVEALVRLRSRSCIIDGEAVACDENGVASFDRIRHRRHDGDAFLYAFDLIELNGDDMRRDPLEVRKATLRCMLAKAGLGLRFNEHLEGDGPSSPMPARWNWRALSASAMNRSIVPGVTKPPRSNPSLPNRLAIRTVALISALARAHPRRRQTFALT